MKTRICFLVLLAASASVPAARATTLVRLSLEQLVQASTEIVGAHVVSQESRWTPDHTRIITLTTLALDQTFKGNPPATLVVEQPGGTVGNTHVRVPGTILFRPQARYVLFLEVSRSNPSHYLPVGMFQGAYRIFRDETTREERVIVPMGSMADTAGSGGGQMNFPAQTVSISEFRQGLFAASRRPLEIPRGTSIPLVIQSVEPRGAGRVRVLARTTVSVYPSSKAIVPAGSRVEGTATLVSRAWKIHWTELDIRGTRVPISAHSEEPAGESLRGRVLGLNLR